MDRLAFVVTALALAVTTRNATAQELATLHVASFAMSADRARVRVGEPFHVTLLARIAERVAVLDNVTLPNLSGFEELGDERRCSATAAGTSCSETLTLDALAEGEQTIGAATLTAVDGRTGRPSRFITNTLAISVLPNDALRASAVREQLFAFAADALRFLLIALTVSVIGAGSWWLQRRLAAKSAAQAAHAFAPVPPLRAAPNDEIERLVAALAREPTRTGVRALRQALRVRASARDDETLADLVARHALPEASGTAALAAVERAAFCEEAELPQAVREALPYLR